MTGGAGFANLAAKSFKNNRLLRKFRTKLKDNPYFGKASRESSGETDFEELHAWKYRKARNARLLRIVIFMILSIIVTVTLLVINRP